MATTPDIPEFTLDIREQIARIDRMQVEIGKWKQEIVKSQADQAKVQLETRLVPWQVFATVLGGAAAFFAAGIAFAKLFVG